MNCLCGHCSPWCLGSCSELHVSSKQVGSLRALPWHQRQALSPPGTGPWASENQGCSPPVPPAEGEPSAEGGASLRSGEQGCWGSPSWGCYGRGSWATGGPQGRPPAMGQITPSPLFFKEYNVYVSVFPLLPQPLGLQK